MIVFFGLYSAADRGSEIWVRVLGVLKPPLLAMLIISFGLYYSTAQIEEVNFGSGSLVR